MIDFVSENYAEAKKRKAELEAESDLTGRILKELSGGGPMGLTPESVRSTKKWKAASRAYSSAFAALRAFNKVYIRRFKKKIIQDRRR